MSNIFPIDFEEKLTMAQDDYILFSDSEDGNKIKKAQYKNLKGEPWTPWTPWKDWKDWTDWAAATITVGSTTTGTPWSSASVTNSWTSSAAVLDFTIPQWAKWETWAWATVAIWTTTTLPAGSSATVTNSWTSTNAVLNFWIPKWDSWSGSWDVNWPASSTDGDVAIFDWTTGKLIKDWSVALSTLSSAASLASSAIQPWDDISDLNNDSGFITGIDSTDVTTALGYTPYNSTNPAWYTTNTWDVVWPASSTDWHLALFDWATWKLIKDGGSVPTWVPSWWTDWQVLSKVSWSVAWATPSGWDVMVSSQTGNILTTGMKIWCGTEGDYANLGTYDSNSLYLTVPWAATPGWTPWANTLVYWEFNWNLNDSSGNNVTLTWTPYGYDTGIQGQALQSTNNVNLQSSLQESQIFSWAFTIAFCANMQNANTLQRIFWVPGSSSWSLDIQYEFYNDFSWIQVYINPSTRIAFPMSQPNVWEWKSLVLTGDWVNQLELYIDGVKTNPYSSYNTPFSYPSPNYPLYVTWRDGSNMLLDGVIIENKHWTQSDVDLYLATYPIS